MTAEYTGPERRSPDPLQSQIEDLIKDAEDPKDRALLMILNRIATNLDVNTSLTRTLTTDLKAHTEAFAKHEKREAELVNQGRGGFRVFVWSSILVQGLVVWWINGHLSEFASTQGAVTTLQVQMAAHVEHHKTEEAARK